MTPFWRPSTDCPGPGSPGGTSFLFIALFMLLLAFFIVLVALSNFEKKRALIIMDSVKTAFSEPDFLSSKPIRMVLPDAAEADVPYEEAAKKVFEDTFRLLELKKMDKANGFKITLNADELFEPDSANLSEAGIYAIREVVAEIRKPNPINEHAFEVYFHTPGKEPFAGYEIPLELVRAGVLARTLEQLGAPKQVFGIGVDDVTKPQTLDVYLYTRPQERAKIDFKPSAEAQP